MSGTSMDGIDMSIIKTNGEDIINNSKNFYYKYSTSFKTKLHNFVNKFDINELNSKSYNKLNDQFAKVTNRATSDLLYNNKIDLIGFHGQTIYHNPSISKSIQIGNPNLLFNQFKVPIVYDFREKDLVNNGEGAPLALIYHKLIIEKNKFKQPSIFLNIGGISNLTYWDGKSLIGFDTGPGNCLLDDYIKINTNNFYDKDGLIASRGSPCNKLIENLLKDPFFDKKPPKSLDRNYFNSNFKTILGAKLSIEDVMSTLVEFTIESIFNSLKFLPKEIKSVFISGGGYHNKYLYSKLMERFKNKIINNNLCDIDIDFVESELIAFIATRSFYKLPITFPTTTGVRKPITGGKIIFE